MVSEGFAATVLPDALASAIGHVTGAVRLPLTAPDLSMPICLLTPRETLGLPAVAALKEVVAEDF